jgi:hypothetical protein
MFEDDSEELLDCEFYTPTQPPPLVGDVGRSFIREKLADNSKKPQQWLEEIRERGSLKNPACSPLISLLQHQGTQPSSAHRYLLEQVRDRALLATNQLAVPCASPGSRRASSVQATAHLLQRISAVQPDRLRPLLDSVFPFVSIPALRPIVVAVLSHVQPVPKSNLLILAEDDDVFWDLPLSVQQQVRPGMHSREIKFEIADSHTGLHLGIRRGI